MRAHAVQLDILWEDKPANYEAVLSLLRSHPPAPGDLIVLPEMFDTGFSLATERTCDSDDATLGFIRRLAQDTRCTVQGARTVIGPDSKGRNRAVACSPTGEVLLEYDKVHPFSFGREPERFAGGSRVATYNWMHDSGASVVAPAVCYDLRFPELFRFALKQGAEVFAIGANWPSARVAHWRALLIARAIENQAFVIAVNRCGSDPHLQYPGASLILSPRGDILAEADHRPTVLSAPIDLADLHAWRSTFPAWRDMKLL